MSIALMTEAWKSEMPSGRKLLLLSLCDNANDQGECYPSLATISKRCGMSERAAQGHLSELQKAGALTRFERMGRSTLYKLNPRRFCTPADSAPPQILHPSPADSAPPPAESAPPTPAESAPITLIEPSLNRQVKHHGAKNRASIAASIFKVDDVDPTVWQDFVTVRKAKKMALTVTALEGIRIEATKAGMTLEAALRQCCLMGWAGFKAEWMAGKASSQTAGLSGETAYQRTMRERTAEFSPTLARKTAPAFCANQPRDLEYVAVNPSH